MPLRGKYFSVFPYTGSVQHLDMQKFGGGKDAFVVAEIGKNFIQSEEDRPVEEYIRNAKALIDEAKHAGADAVKFQTHEVEDEQMQLPIVSPHFKGMDRYRWVKRNTEATPPQFWESIKEYCDARDILFFSTPMSKKAAEKLEVFDVPFWKVSSADVQDVLLLRHLRSTKKPIIISTGMVSRSELEDVVETLGQQDLAILYCVSIYPCPPEHFNLASIAYLRKKYPDAVIGFSDHSLGHDVALAAVKIGARIIEKHFSLSRDLWGPDHKVSMTPEEMRAMVQAIRCGAFANVDERPYMGTPDQEFEGADNAFRPYFLKKLIAARDLPVDTILIEDDLYAMRPAKELAGLPSRELPNVLGKSVAKALKKYDPVTADALR